MRQRRIAAGEVDPRGGDKPLKETWPSSLSAGNPTKGFQEGITESNVHFKAIIQAVLRRADLKRMEQAAQKPGVGEGGGGLLRLNRPSPRSPCGIQWVENLSRLPRKPLSTWEPRERHRERDSGGEGGGGGPAGPQSSLWLRTAGAPWECWCQGVLGRAGG